MDLSKNGKFIAKLRKEKNLTQLQLAVKLSVSEKTISKWECGNGFPDTTLMLPLCKVLGITANELLLGKRITNEKDFAESSNETIVNLNKHIELKNKYLKIFKVAVYIYSILIFIATPFITSYITNNIGIHIIMGALVITELVFAITLGMMSNITIGKYKCKKCGYTYIPGTKELLNAFYIGNKKYLKCQKCNKRSFHKFVKNTEEE